jgi:hypothetical protein
VIKRKLFALEDATVRAQFDLYRQAFEAIRYEAEHAPQDRQWPDRVNAAASRVIARLKVDVAATALQSALVAFRGGYYGRAWVLDMATRPDVKIAAPPVSALDGVLGEAVDWAREQEAEIVRSLMGEAWQVQFADELDVLIPQIRIAIRTGQAEGEGIDAIMRRVRRVMGVETDRRRGAVGSNERRLYRANFNRVQTITRTVTNKAANTGAWQAYRVNQDVLTGYQWLTARDERVCFPAFTLVETETGPMPIQDIRPGMKVWTRKGLRRVMAASNRLYSGDMVRVHAGNHEVVSTADHPYWTLEQGWLEGRDLDASNHLQTFSDQPIKVDRVVNFRIGDTDNAPTSGLQVASLSGISLGVLMPVHAVNLKGHAVQGQQEINAVSADLDFLSELNTHRFECQSNGTLNPVFTYELPVAGKAAKPSLGVSRSDAVLLPAVRTFDVCRRASAFFGTKTPVAVKFAGEQLAASLAVDVLRERQTAFAATDGVSAGNAGLYAELFSADRTCLRGVFGSAMDFVALTGTEALASVFARFEDGVGFAAFLTGSAHSRLAELVEVFTTTKDMSVNLTRRFLHFLAAQRTWNNGHVSQLLTNLTVLYHGWQGNPITVYDIEVETDHEFYANGVLVHNCPICAGLDGTTYRLGDTTRPPAHPNCRCSVVPTISPDLAANFSEAPRETFEEWAAGRGLSDLWDFKPTQTRML